MPRFKQFNEEEALIKAMELFWEKGYDSTSLTDLTGYLGISKGSFYDTFHGKRAIFDKAIDFYRISNFEALQSLLASESDVKKGIRKLFELNVDRAFSGTLRKGCFMANTCAELAGEDQKIKDVLDKHNQTVCDTIHGYLEKGGFGEDKDLKAITNLFMTLFTGINIESKYKKDKNQFLKSIDLALHLLD